MRDFIVGNDSLGKHAHDQKVSTDSVVMHKHLPSGSPPKGSESMPKHETVDKTKSYNRSIKDLRNDLKGRNLSTKGDTAEVRDRLNKANLPIKTKEKIGNSIKGHERMKLGLIEALWRRGTLILMLLKYLQIKKLKS